MAIKNCISECFSSGGKISSKRVVTATATLVWIVCVITELFSDNSVSENTMDVILFIIGIGIGATASERFAKKPSQ
tara:strand:- start:851 stop:1078 length:228 start_codon:yes stop_codon:yes gene_type:complete